MPNWCDTSYKCVGNSDEVRKLYPVLKYMENRKTSILPNDFGKMWLGNLIHKLGGNWEELRCRGEITDFSLDGDILTINQQTAWCEQEGVRLIIEQTFPSIKVYYLEQESGLGVFNTNDITGEFFPERYFYESHEDCEYFETLNDAKEFISRIVGYNIELSVVAINIALDDYEKSHKEENEDMFYFFHEIYAYDN